MGSDAASVSAPVTVGLFQSTLPGWGATSNQLAQNMADIFQSTLPGWGATQWSFGRRLQILFQSTLPGWGATHTGGWMMIDDAFQSTLPGWGATRHVPQLNLINVQFQSTLPGWGATKTCVFSQSKICISIHAPRMGSDLPLLAWRPPSPNFNPRSPDGERLPKNSLSATGLKFQSTLPGWGATSSRPATNTPVGISIHAPRMGSDAPFYRP